ncbi:MAG: lycopene cyclase domain-containing protein [Owenweeksia sp.]|nr:lycopene cyclase domain-containing protein [Owenweeksia sp.]
MESKYLYLLLMGVSLLVPLLRSFEKRVAFYRSFGPLFISIAIVGGLFIVWDIIFTHYGFWGFNARYVSGLYLANLPAGEWLFFIVIPFCCVFIYRVMNYFFPGEPWNPVITRNIGNFLIGFSAALAITFYQHWYTLLTFGFLFLLIVLHSRIWHTPWLAQFYRAYLVILVPFFMVNGILTGFGLEEEVVWYNEMEMTGTRIATVPFEDAFYGMVLILGVISIYEYLGKKWGLSYARGNPHRIRLFGYLYLYVFH